MAAFPKYEVFENLNPMEVSRAANLFETLKQLRIKLKNGDEAVLERAFEFHVQGVLDKLDARLQSIHEPQQQNVELIMARHGLYDAAFQQVALLCHSSKIL
jgi:putative NIF3 family GTP cyclohydrolase 1 type 2